ncbi:hypothetical protein PMZ80_009651 [Knufia obscura]|uniref:Uncharacterized protein n=2 Tax=Knufia TaxID=430999 RepID=A0AAN8I439_9EURO|nr:hypothetical protein PMZ80_009651 [Knufia obscura]KAK5951064.1 hypothetical protein OHC33_007817 [Knufia fluminis]
MDRSTAQRDSGKAGLLDLPVEITEQILKPLLQHSLTQITKSKFYDIWLPGVKEISEKGPVVIGTTMMMPHAQLQVQILRTCRKLYDIGAPLLYGSTLFFHPVTWTGYDDPDALAQQRKITESLRRPRKHRFTKLFLVIVTPDGWSRAGRASDGEVLDEGCEALAAHQPCWTELQFVPIDMTAEARYTTNRGRCLRLLYGLGRLHCLENSALHAGYPLSDDLIHMTVQAGYKFPLWVLHEDLEQLLDTYDPDGASGTPIWDMKRFFAKQSEQYANERNDDLFFVNLDAAVEYVKTVVGQALGKPLKIDFSMRENVLRMATEEADNLLSAREGKWRSRYTISKPRIYHPYHRRGLPPFNANAAHYITI